MNTNNFVFNVEVYSADICAGIEIELVANWTYTPFSRGYREGGMQMEPDEEETFEINSITPNDTVPSPLAVLVADHFNSCEDFESLIETIKFDAANNAEDEAA